MDYNHLATMAKTASALNAVCKYTTGNIFTKIVINAGSYEAAQISEHELSSVCVDQIEQALIAEAERYRDRIKGYVNNVPDANILYEN